MFHDIISRIRIRHFCLNSVVVINLSVFLVGRAGMEKLSCRAMILMVRTITKELKVTESGVDKGNISCHEGLACEHVLLLGLIEVDRGAVETR